MENIFCAQALRTRDEQKHRTEQDEGDRCGFSGSARVRMARLIADGGRKQQTIGAEVEPRRVLQQRLQTDEQDHAGQSDRSGSRDPPRHGGYEQSSAGERYGYRCPGLHGSQPRQHGLERGHVERPADQDSKAERERYQPACARNNTSLERGRHALARQFSWSASGKLFALGTQRERLPEEHAEHQERHRCAGNPGRSRGGPEGRRFSMPRRIDAGIFRRIKKIGNGDIQTVAQARQIAPQRDRPLRLGVGFADDLEPIGHAGFLGHLPG